MIDSLLPLVFLLPLATVSVAAAPAAAAPSSAKKTITGVISDNMCAQTGHAAMRMGPTDAECTVACVDAHGALYVLVSGRDVYALTDQQTPQRFAGQKVRVTGTVEDAKGAKLFHVISIVEAK